MDTTAFLGLFAITGGIVFYFTSGAFTILNPLLGIIFHSLGMILVYMGIALVLWCTLSSIDVFLERLGKQG